MTPSQKNGVEQGALLAAASMAAEALALSRVVCAEGEALAQCGAPEVRESAVSLLTAVTQAQRSLNHRLESALTACGCFPGAFRLASQYNGFWWEAERPFPWIPAAGSPCLEHSCRILLPPGYRYRLHISLAGFPVGTSSNVLLRLSGPRHTDCIPLFTLCGREPKTLQKTLILSILSEAVFTLEISGGLGACVFRAGMEITGMIIDNPTLDSRSCHLELAPEGKDIREASNNTRGLSTPTGSGTIGG